MRRMFTALAAAFAIVAFSSVTFAQAPAATAEKAAKPVAEKVVKPAAEKTAQTATETAKKPAHTAKGEAKEAVKKATAATGTIEKYDAATKTLTVKTKKGDENFTLNADTKIVAGTKAGKEDELVAGKHVKVAYSDNAGQMTATKVTLAGEKAPKAEKKEPKKEEPKK